MTGSHANDDGDCTGIAVDALSPLLDFDRAHMVHHTSHSLTAWRKAAILSLPLGMNSWPTKPW